MSLFIKSDYGEFCICNAFSRPSVFKNMSHTLFVIVFFFFAIMKQLQKGWEKVKQPDISVNSTGSVKQEKTGIAEKTGAFSKGAIRIN